MRKYLFILAAISLVFAYIPQSLLDNGSGYNSGEFESLNEKGIQEELVPDSPDRGYDVSHYEYRFMFEIPDSNLQAIARIRGVFTSERPETLKLDLANEFLVGTYEFDLAADYRRGEECIVFELEPGLGRGDSFELMVIYEGIPTTGYFYEDTPYGTRCYFTKTEPVDSKHWLLCNDVPWDKATLDLYATIPMGNEMLSNGTLMSIDTTESRYTYHWQETHKIATYLISVAIMDYAIIHDEYEGMEVDYYAFPEDSEAVAYDWERTPEMIELYSELFIPYPFDKYHQAEVVMGGAMEHQTCTSMGNNLVTGDRNWEWVVAHELAHQWFGDLVTCETWKDLWLNEGFATFSEPLWIRHTEGDWAYRDYCRYLQDRYMAHVAAGYEGRFPIYDPEYMWGVTVYHKAGAVLDMLRTEMGDSLFFYSVREYLESHAFEAANTEMFIRDMEEYSGLELRWFFDQWIFQPGHPHLECEWSCDDSTMYFEFEQVQPDTSLFRLQMEIYVYDADTNEVLFKTIIDRSRSYSCSFNLPEGFCPDSVKLDKYNKTLYYEESVMGISESVTKPAELALTTYPNPFNTGLNIDINSTGNCQLTITDIKGNTVHEAVCGGASCTWDASGMSTGVYIVNVFDGSTTYSNKVLLAK